MKKISLFLFTMAICLFSACHNGIWNAIDELDGRVTKLEELCKEMNTNITSLQTIVSVLEANDYITGIVEIKKGGEIIGYTITFGKHDPITIYNGEDGSASAPVIGVAKDTNGVYYWTLNGEWLLDDNGNKIPVSGTDGKDGAKPKLKIEDGYWYVSYDDGTTWEQLGKAVGENGQDGNKGDKGDKGEDGDSMFQSVTQDENYVYFTLADGTIIKIAKGDRDQSNDEFIFTITYDPNGGEGVMQKDTFYYGYVGKIAPCTFTRNGYYYINWNTSPSGIGAFYEDNYELLIDKNITLYAQWGKATGTHVNDYVDLGLSVKWATCNIGATKPEEYGGYFAWGETTIKTNYADSNYLADAYIGNLKQRDDAASVNWGYPWRMPTEDEWQEVIDNCNISETTLNNIKGYRIISKINKNEIFIPAGGLYEGTVNTSNTDARRYAYYWSSTCSKFSNGAPCPSRFYTGKYQSSTNPNHYYASTGISAGSSSYFLGCLIRPVCP